MKVGFIGTGSMGSILIEAFIDQEHCIRSRSWPATVRLERRIRSRRDAFPVCSAADNGRSPA